MSYLRSTVAVLVAATIITSSQIAYAQVGLAIPSSVATPSVVSATIPTAPAPVDNHAAIGSSGSIADGTIITMQNWQNYRQFMPDGMVAFFEGRYFWKMPADIQMPVGPTIIHPLPSGYMEATEKYAAQVKIVEQSDGGLTLTGYNGGIPFPRPDEPHKGWKILANLWFRYTPHLTVNTRGVVCFIDSSGSTSCKAGMKIYRQLSFNTDPQTPDIFPGAEGKYFTQFEMVEEPEQERYTAILAISHTDLARPEEVYVFIPSLRRYQPLSPSARCSNDLGTDETPDDRRYGFDSNITQLNVEYNSAKKILSLMGFKMPSGRFPENYDMPLGWPLPSWGKWQLRDAYQISLNKIPLRSAGYCFAKRVMYIDGTTYAPLWEDLYDKKVQLNRSLAFFLRTLEIPGVGPQDSSNSMVYGIWDVKTKHATIFAEPGDDRPFYVNEQAPQEFTDLNRYTTPSGLGMIMR
jgi:hypothetical protein